MVRASRQLIQYASQNQCHHLPSPNLNDPVPLKKSMPHDMDDPPEHADTCSMQLAWCHTPVLLSSTWQPYPLHLPHYPSFTSHPH
jgi:hypothetical protein